MDIGKKIKELRVALIVAIELTHQHVTNAIVVYRVVKPNKRSHTVGSLLYAANETLHDFAHAYLEEVNK